MSEEKNWCNNCSGVYCERFMLPKGKWLYNYCHTSDLTLGEIDTNVRPIWCPLNESDEQQEAEKE
jgi:hypothetical protein